MTYFWVVWDVRLFRVEWDVKPQLNQEFIKWDLKKRVREQVQESSMRRRVVHAWWSHCWFLEQTSRWWTELSGWWWCWDVYNALLAMCSACTSASLEPSYVLRAIGTDEDLAHSSIRLVLLYLSEPHSCASRLLFVLLFFSFVTVSCWLSIGFLAHVVHSLIWTQCR